MNKRVVASAAFAALVVAGAVAAQGRIMDMVADKVICKYQSATCEQLWQTEGPAQVAGGAAGRAIS